MREERMEGRWRRGDNGGRKEGGALKCPVVKTKVNEDVACDLGHEGGANSTVVP